MPAIRVAVAGATGYSGEELIRLLLDHPEVHLTCLAASAKWERPVPASQVFPRFARRLDLAVEALDLPRLAERSDAVFLALPHGKATELVPSLLAAGKRIVDLSGDFRLRDPTLYPQWYQFTHAHPELLTDGRVAYGLTEFHRQEIAAARLVANPGCYATSVLLGVLPLFRAKLLEEAQIIVDAKSGLSGAGRKADETLLFTEMTENLRAYKVNEHQHMPEILQDIERLTGQQASLTFVPQVIPVSRGLISTIYVKTRRSPEEVAAAFEACYPPAQAPFVRVRRGSLPQLKDVVGTNYCDIGIAAHPAGGVMVIGSALDNLTKGAAGQAIQNFNLMHGFSETAGLR
ncbi:MAG: N-acetyl-gamma-glutamyl-phosphate reductase [Candidatus Omnitrophica bacterium]|nr:N-acetyl-gamma-glutamyl-phosphate reductase [Candidatus Omnitrophota bacterium]